MERARRARLGASPLSFSLPQPFRTEYERWRVKPNFFTDRKEEALALKAHFMPGDSIVLRKIGKSDITPTYTSTTAVA